MTNPIPAGSENPIPHLIVSDCNAAIEFYKNAFGAEEVCRMPTPDGGKIMHAEVAIGKHLIYLCDDFPEMCGGKTRDPLKLGGSPVTIHCYVEDCGASIAKAEQAGATVTMPAQDMFWGDRYGTIADPFGHAWSFATHIKDMTPEEITAAGAAAFAEWE